MLRRGFLGSVIGTLIVSRLPFVAAAPKIVPFVNEDLRERFLRTASRRDLMRCVGNIRFEELIQGTPIVDVKHSGLKWEFTYEPFVANQTLDYRGCQIVRPDGLILLDGTFDYQGRMYANDTLKVTNTIQGHYNAKD